MSGFDRRGFLLGSVGVLGTAALGRRAEIGAQERPDPLPSDLVFDFVRAAHSDLSATKGMLDAEPGLLNATWDWGAGDFESALGGASHMGDREIAGFLLDRGARLDLFCAATMGMIEVIRPVVDAYPAAVQWEGPHGIPLIRHAELGESREVLEFLRSRGA